MFSAYIRAALSIGAAVLVGGLLEFIVPFMLPYQGAEGDLLYDVFAATADHGLLVMVIAVAVGLLARATVESGGVS